VKLSRDAWLALGLLAVLVIILSVSVFGQQQDQGQLPPLTSSSSAPDGALALKLWLGQMNYPILEDLPSTYALPDQAKIVLALEPAAFQPDELAALDRWVSNGGTLIAAGDQGLASLAEHFGFGMSIWDVTPKTFVPETPLFVNPPLPGPVAAPPLAFQPVFYFVPSRRSYVNYLAADGKPVLVSFDVVQGRVILASTSYPFSNSGLKQPGNPALVLNLLGRAKQQGAVWFDEFHHGFGGASATGPESWLRYTPLGRSLLFIFFVIFLALLFRGRGFGRPVPLPYEIKRRGALEHVSAVANLSRLAGHREPVLLQYHHELKRSLGRRYRLDPTLPDVDYVNSLVRYNPAIDGPSLLALLGRLKQPHLSEAEMVRVAAEAVKWIKA